MRIAVAGDMHYPEFPMEQRSLISVRDDFYDRFFRRFFAIDADLYVSIGDLTNFGTNRELQEIYSLIHRFNKPFIHVLGNHDVYGNKREDVLDLTGQKRYHSIATDIVDLAFIDTTRDRNTKRWDGTVDDEQLNWLSDVIKHSEDKPLLVFGHHPLSKTTAYSEQHYSSIDPTVPLWDILKDKHGKGMYVNGHNHYYSIAKRDQWTFTQLACILDHQAIRIIDIEKHKIDCKTIAFPDDKMKKQAYVLANAMRYFEFTENFLEGEEALTHTVHLYEHSVL